MTAAVSKIKKIMYKPHRKPRPKSKTSDTPSLLHHTFLLGRARFIAQPLSALRVIAHFTVAGENEAGVDLVLIQPFLLYYVNHVFLVLTSIF